MPEVLLSRPLLQSLRFDLPKHLGMLRDQFQDVNCSHIEFLPDPSLADQSPPLVPCRLAALLLLQATQDKPRCETIGQERESIAAGNCDLTTPQASRYGNPPIPSPLFYGDVIGNDPFYDVDAPVIGQQNPHELQPHLQNLVDNAIQARLPDNFYGEISNLVWQ